MRFSRPLPISMGVCSPRRSPSVSRSHGAPHKKEPRIYTPKSFSLGVIDIVHVVGLYLPYCLTALLLFAVYCLLPPIELPQPEAIVEAVAAARATGTLGGAASAVSASFNRTLAQLLTATDHVRSLWYAYAIIGERGRAVASRPSGARLLPPTPPYAQLSASFMVCARSPRFISWTLPSLRLPRSGSALVRTSSRSCAATGVSRRSPSRSWGSSLTRVARVTRRTGHQGRRASCVRAQRALTPRRASATRALTAPWPLRVVSQKRSSVIALSKSWLAQVSACVVCVVSEL